MSNVGIIAVSRKGADLARRLTPTLDGEVTLHIDRRFAQPGDGAVPFDLPLRPVVQLCFTDYQQLVMFLPIGAAVRLLVPYLRHKSSDPAVVCVDDSGRFSVSLISGHLGGADALAQRVASSLGSIAVITSASHVMGTLAVDLLGQEFGWSLNAESEAVTRASAAVVNGEPVGIYQESGEPGWWPHHRPLPSNITVFESLESLAASPCAAALLVTDRKDYTLGQPRGLSDALAKKNVIVYYPKSLVVGMGCRRGVPMRELEQLWLDTFKRHDLAPDSLRCIATAELKRDEPGLQELAEKYGVPLYCYDADELNGMFAPVSGDSVQPGQDSSPDQQAYPRPTPSENPRRLVGVWGVAEPAALLASGSNGLLVTREKTSCATIAVARRMFPNS